MPARRCLSAGRAELEVHRRTPRQCRRAWAIVSLAAPQLPPELKRLLGVEVGSLDQGFQSFAAHVASNVSVEWLVVLKKVASLRQPSRLSMAPRLPGFGYRLLTTPARFGAPMNGVFGAYLDRWPSPSMEKLYIAV